jgi:hypothetical protein
VPAVQTCSTSAASKKRFISIYQLLKRLDDIPNGLWLSEWSILNGRKKKTKTTFCYYNVSVGFNPNRSLQLVGRKILSANWKTNENILIECCLVILTHTRSKIEQLLYIYFDLLPWVFQCCFLFMENCSLGKIF